MIGYQPVPRDWFPAELAGAGVLCLASGGGQQWPVLSAAGALRPGGTLMAGFLNPDIFIFDVTALEERGELTVRHQLPFSRPPGLTPKGFCLAKTFHGYHRETPSQVTKSSRSSVAR